MLFREITDGEEKKLILMSERRNAPSVDGAANPGTFGVRVTNTVNQAHSVSLEKFTDDQQLVFQVVL
jgi:hypothetical protein